MCKAFTNSEHLSSTNTFQNHRNASATEALPIFLSAVVDEVVAIILSVTAVLLFGEIIPASILTGVPFDHLISLCSYLMYLCRPRSTKDSGNFCSPSVSSHVYFFSNCISHFSRSGLYHR